MASTQNELSTTEDYRFLIMYDKEKGMQWWFARLQDAMIDWRLGIQTRGVTQIGLPGSTDSMTLPYKDIMHILSAIGLQPTDVVVDIGCGKGRVLCCSALFQVHEVIGIDHAPEQCVIARNNVERLRGKRSSVRVVQASATEYDYQNGTVFYMYNPFDETVMKNVLERIHQSVSARGLSDDNGQSPKRIIYANPVHESCLAASPWLEVVDRWSAGGNRDLAVPVSFWRIKSKGTIGEVRMH